MSLLSRSLVQVADVLSLVHSKPQNHGQALLFKDIVDRRFNPVRPIPAELGMLAARTALTRWDVERRRELFDQKGEVEEVADALLVRTSGGAVGALGVVSREGDRVFAGQRA